MELKKTEIEALKIVSEIFSNLSMEYLNNIVQEEKKLLNQIYESQQGLEDYVEFCRKLQEYKQLHDECEFSSAFIKLILYKYSCETDLISYCDWKLVLERIWSKY